MNDLKLAELVAELHNRDKALDGLIREGHETTVFREVYSMLKCCDRILERLNDIKYGR